MFIGHFAVGLGAKVLQPKLSLGTLFLAVQFLDLLWPNLLMLNLEQVNISPGITQVGPLEFTSYPISHSLIMAILWSVLFGLTYYLITTNKNEAIVLGLCVLSHWVLDYFVHIPDLPLSPIGNCKVGLGLWNSLYFTVLLETILFIIGIRLYYSSLKKTGAIVSWGFWGLVGLLYFVYLLNIFGPIPNNTKEIVIGAQLQWLLIVWAYWIDRKKKMISIA